MEGSTLQGLSYISMASNNSILPRAIFSSVPCVSIWGGSMNDAECVSQQLIQPSENQLTQGESTNGGWVKKNMFPSNKKQRQPVTGLMIPILYIDRFWLLAIQRFSDLEQYVIMCIFLFKCRSTNFMGFFGTSTDYFFSPKMNFWIANVGAFRNFFFLMTVISHLTRT